MTGINVAAPIWHILALRIPNRWGRWNGHEPGADVATYLARNGIKVTVDRLPSAGRRVDEVFNQHAIDTTADLIVIGAYGHTSLRERIFGGVTKAMIEAPFVPVLMVR